MVRLLAVLLGLAALAALLVAVFSGAHDVEDVARAADHPVEPPARRSDVEEQEVRPLPRERMRVAEVPPSATAVSPASEPAAPPNLRASTEVGEDVDLVHLQATIRPSDRSADAATLSVSVAIVPATTRFSVTLGARPDAGTVRVSGEYQIIAHAPGGEVFVPTGIARMEQELVTIDESTGVISGISNSLGGARQVAGETTNPQGEVVGRTTSWGRLAISFEVRGTPYSMYVTVPKFDAGRPRSVQIFDGPSPLPSGR